MKDPMGQDQFGQRAPTAPAPLMRVGGSRSASQGQEGAVHDHDPRIISIDEQQKAFGRAQRHTKRVKRLKWGLPLIAIGIIAGFVTWVVQQKPIVEPEEPAIVQTAFQQDELIMQNPNLNGFSDGRAYEVIAKRAVQKVATPDVINLEDLTARITDEKEQWVTVTAQKGQFNQNSEELALFGDVDVKSSLGYDLKTDIVHIEMKKGYLQTQTPVEIISNDIRLRANKLEAINNGERFRFIGNVRLRVDAAMMKQNEKERPTEEANQ